MRKEKPAFAGRRWYEGYSIQLMIIIGELAFIAGILASLASRL